jgi:hypothetical protein
MEAAGIEPATFPPQTALACLVLPPFDRRERTWQKLALLQMLSGAEWLAHLGYVRRRTRRHEG